MTPVEESLFLVSKSIQVSKRAVRERYTLMSEKIKAKMRDEEKASGIEGDLSEVEKALEEIAEKEAAAEDTVKNVKKKVDNATEQWK